MELIHKFLNFVAPPFAFFSLCCVMPPYLLWKAFLYVVFSIFSENVAGKVVLITGASSGIGEHLAYEYASKGAFLALVARREKSLGEVAETASQMGSPEVITINADVQNVDDCRHVVEQTVNHFGRLDHLVNNAGISGIGMLEDITDITQFKTIMDTNFWGKAYMTRFAIPHLRESGGKIIAMSSSASWLPMPRMSIYNASKAALVTFFETLRVELSPDVHVLICTPGFIESELTQGKVLLQDGRMDVDQDLRDVHISMTPVETAASCARAIVNSACRGDKYLTEPSWFRVTWLWKVFCPDVLEWTHRFFYLSRQDAPAIEAPSKKLLDLTGAQRLLYPESIQNPGQKRE